MKTDNLPGLYIHIPFCSQRCRYCDFFSVPVSGQVEQWKKALIREAREHQDFAPLFGSLYLGGGTPSLLPLDKLEEITAYIYNLYDFSEDAEVTIEINPEDVTADFVSGLIDLGFNRLSLGVQSFRDEELNLLGRRHDSAGAEEALEICLESGIENVSIDLIFAVCYQTMKQWKYNLQRALSFKPHHISCYQLTLKRGSELEQLSRNGQIMFPPEELQRDMFITASGTLTENGYSHYEVSSYCRGEDRKSRHNRIYWKHLPFLGLGPSAHSFDGRIRWWNSSSMDKYIKRQEGEKAGLEELSFEKLDLERIFLGLRTSEGIGLELAVRYQADEGGIDMLIGQGLLKIRGDRLVPTRKGYLFADHIALSFFTQG